MCDVVHQELQLMLADQSHLPAGGGSEADLAVILNPLFSLSVRALLPDRRLSERLCSTAQHALVGLVPLPHPTVVSLDMFEQLNPTPYTVVDRSKELTPRASRTLRAGSVTRIRAAIDVFRVNPVDSPALIIMFATTNVVPLRIEYDTDTLRPSRAIAASLESSRLEFTARMLSEIGNANSIASMSGLIEHPDHFVRWAAIRSVSGIDIHAGRNLVLGALDDAHPHVRAAAARALTAIDAALADVQPA